MMICPDSDWMWLLIENMEELSSWLEKDNITDPELAYWIPKCILVQGDKSFAKLGSMSARMLSLSHSQDTIGWRNFTEGYISTHFYDIQNFHLLVNSSYLNGANCRKHFISRMLHISHPQWIFRNISLHNCTRGYIHNMRVCKKSPRK
jgi:hypothetical protein